MNWEAIGAIGEIIGAFAVVLTLGYLATQIRQNTKAERNTAMQHLLAASAATNNLIAGDEQLASTLSKGFKDPQALSDAERLQVNAQFIGLMQHMDGAFHMHKAGLLDDEIWAKFEYELPIWLHIPMIREWYDSDRYRLSKSFQKYLDERLSETEAPPVIPAFGRELPTDEL